MPENILPLQIIKDNPPLYTFPPPPPESPSPPAKVTGALFETESLSTNFNRLHKSLWRTLLEVRLKAMDYAIQNPNNQPNEPIKVQYSKPADYQPPEANSLNKLYTLCEQEAYIISKLVLEYIKAAQLSLHVKVPHATSAQSYADLLTAHNTPPPGGLWSLYFDIEEGGNSSPKGLDI